MSWIEAKHRRSEEKAQMLQELEINKIRKQREDLFAIVDKLSYDNFGISRDVVEVSHCYLSDDTDCSDYGTDTYRLAKQVKLQGRVMQLDTISPTLLRKHDLYTHLANAPASHRFPAACSGSAVLRESLGLTREYNYKTCIIDELSHVSVTFSHGNAHCIDLGKSVMPDDVQRYLTKRLSIISEKDFSDVRVLYLILPEVVTAAPNS
ncbi:hypothetical protein [Hymenobacter weizhouensis]|uniref:hypothetical protein n=1 Tax=Hymenobacter sp. YIM 151500-1 TaxID=2987689 RepID=UPI002225C274|nr:hypothetical protein [Hymenobacter sp. YIM 151500-1]UYZ65294.1 hypothetical protein OIS53_20100 [Hymenobacter sp. YIM 151500-1]